MQERVENLHDDVVKEHNVTIMSCLGHDKIMKELENAAKELETVVNFVVNKC